jgi:aspartate carbamoyltransferase catalytic subunit
MLLTTKAMRPARQLARTMASASRTGPPPHLLTLADLSPAQITSLIQSAITFKHLSKTVSPTRVEQTLDARTVALLFSKRSTRTRVASETSAKILGGHPLFLGSADSQLGVNESLEDTARVVGSMVDGIMARVNLHDEVAVCPFQPRQIIELNGRHWQNTRLYQSSTPFVTCITQLRSWPTY